MEQDNRETNDKAAIQREREQAGRARTKTVNGHLHRGDIAFVAECTTTSHRVGDSEVRVMDGSLSLREGQPI